MRALLVILVGAVMIGVCVAQNQELGTVVEFVPKSHSADSAFGYGLVAVVLQHADIDYLKPTFIARSADEFIRQYAQLPKGIQNCGIWITLAEDDAYSPEEKAMLEALKGLCRKHQFPLLIHVGKEDKGWQRFSSNRTNRFNQAMRPTASKPAICDWSVSRRERMLRGMHRGLAAADLEFR